MESKDMTQYREVTVKVLVMDSKDALQQEWLSDAITDALLETEGERITSFEIGQPFEK
jgi:hypothetical protein